MKNKVMAVIMMVVFSIVVGGCARVKNETISSQPGSTITIRPSTRTPPPLFGDQYPRNISENSLIWGITNRSNRPLPIPKEGGNEVVEANRSLEVSLSGREFWAFYNLLVTNQCRGYPTLTPPIKIEVFSCE